MKKPKPTKDQRAIQQYGRAARGHLKRPSTVKQWALYSAAGASALAAAAAASTDIVYASVIYSGVQNIGAGPVFAPNGYDGASVNIDGAGLAEFFLGAERGTFSSFSNSQTYRYNQGGAFLQPNTAIAAFPFIQSTSGGLPASLAAGAPISYSAGYFGFFGGLRYKVGPTSGSPSFVDGNFLAGQTGIAGFSFNPGDGFHYGWIRLLVGEDEIGYPNQVTAIDWAYESVAGQRILAGQTEDTPVPEPGSLALLATGAVGVAAWRRRRAEQPKPTAPAA